MREALAEAAEADVRFLRRNLLLARRLFDDATPGPSAAKARKSTKGQPNVASVGDGDESTGDGDASLKANGGGGPREVPLPWSSLVAQARTPSDFASVMRSLHQRMHENAMATRMSDGAQGAPSVSLITTDAWSAGWVARVAASTTLSQLAVRLIELECQWLPSETVIPYSTQPMHAGQLIQIDLAASKHDGGRLGVWRDAMIVACWRDSSFRVRCDVKGDPESPYVFDFDDPSTTAGKAVLHHCWQPHPKIKSSRLHPPVAPSRGGSGGSGGSSSGGGGAAAAAGAATTAAIGQRGRRGVAERASRGPSNRRGVAAVRYAPDSASSGSDSSGDEDDDDEEVPVPMLSVGDAIEVRLKSAGGKRKAREEWVTAEVVRLCRNGVFEALPADADGAKVRCELRANARQWRVKRM